MENENKAVVASPAVDERKAYETITEQEVADWCAMPATDATLSRLTDLLNGLYSLDNAR